MLEAEALQGRRGEAGSRSIPSPGASGTGMKPSRPGKVSVSGALFRWASVDDKGPQGDLRREVDGLDPIQALTGSCEKLINVHSVHAATAAVMTVPAASLGWCRAGPG